MPALRKRLEISAVTPKGVSGKCAPGLTIEAINLSKAPTARLRVDDTVAIGAADASGHFDGKYVGHLVGTRSGDVVRLRGRKPNGKTTDWITVRVSGTDKRNAELALFRIGMTPNANGRHVDVENINSGRPISEPGARLRFVNLRSGDAKEVTLDAEGEFPKGLKLKGKAGDVFTVAVSDGAYNQGFTTIAGKLAVGIPGAGRNGGIDIADPGLHRDELNRDGSPKFVKKRFTGPVFAREVSPSDVMQGHLADCYFPAAVAAIAGVAPAQIRKMVAQNPDKTYTVTFKKRNRRTGKFTDVRVKVDGDLYVRAGGGPLYGRSTNSEKADKMEMWFPIMEKAYAAWMGSYDKIGNGGYAEQVLEDCTGRLGYSKTLKPSGVAAAWTEIENAVKEGRPACLGTYGKAEQARFHNTGVYPDHSYSLLDCAIEGGKQLVRLRNPWGEGEPGNDGKNDGTFWMEIDTVCQLFDAFCSVR